MIENLLEFVDTLQFGRFQSVNYIIKFDLPIDCDLSNDLIRLCFFLGSN